MDLQFVLAVILDLLVDRPYEFGARLKQRLNRRLVSESLPALDENQFGYRKFHDFLTGELGDRLTIDRPSTDGDIRVSLNRSLVENAIAHGASYDVDHFLPYPMHRSMQVTPKSSVSSPIEGLTSHEIGPIAEVRDGAEVIAYRGDIWQAFTNLNPLRKRYFDKDANQVIHFIDGTDINIQSLVDADPVRFAAVSPIDRAVQQGWMREFLERLELPEPELAILKHLAVDSYTSKANVMFGRALGERQGEWKAFRAERVDSIIQAWGKANDVPQARLILQKAAPAPAKRYALTASPSALSSRGQAQKLLELMSDYEIATVAIPVLLSFVLTKSRL